MRVLRLLFAAAVMLGWSSRAFAEPATIVFTNGAVVYLDDTNAYQKITEAILRAGKTGPAFAELGIKSGSFLLNVDRIAMVCRYDCRKIVYVDPRATESDSKGR